MQPGNPYHLIEAVGSCQVGSVWSAIDPQGRSLMVALLDPNVATDHRWREAFQEAANALVQAGEPGYLYADFASSSPWVAYAAENGIGAERVFLALGMDFQPVPPDGLGPMDYTPFEPTTQMMTTPAETPPAPPEQPTAPVQHQPLPPDVIASAEAQPTTVFPPVQPGPPATESAQPVAAQPVAAQHSPAPPPQEAFAPRSAPPIPPPAPAPMLPPEPSTDELSTTQETQRMDLPPAAQPAPVQPWAANPPPQAAPSLPQQIPFPAAPSPYGGAPTHPVSGAPHPVSGSPHPVSGSPHPVSGSPHPISGAPHPTSGGPGPVSGTPMSPAYGQPLSPAYGAPVYGPRPPQGPAPYDPYAPVAPPPRRSRGGLWIGIAVAVLVLIAGGGGVYAWTANGDTPDPPARSNAATEAPLPTATALSPGVEPPADGNWNLKWPKFGNGDRVRRLSLEGVGFDFTVPQDWDCVPAGSGEGLVEYDCGASPGNGPEIGGQLIVRDCTQPCTEERRLAMRKAEEAWGLQWQRGSRTSAYAETNEINGQPRYGLVIVAYWRSSPDQAIDRQLVFRMTAPVNQADVLRKISNSVRVGALF